MELVWKLLTLVSVSVEIKIYDGRGLNPLMREGRDGEADAGATDAISWLS